MARSSCAADGFRHGRWLPQPTATAACANYSYTNATCLHPVSAASLCYALDGTDVLQLVGDSLMLNTWTALLDVLRAEASASAGHGGKRAASSRHAAGSGGTYFLEECDAQADAPPPPNKHAEKRLKCGSCCCKAFSLPCGTSRRPVRIRFLRHNHLTGEFLPEGGAFCPSCRASPSAVACLRCRKQLQDRTCCAGWRRPSVLAAATTLVLGTGSHVLEVPSHNASGTFERRADDLGTLLATHHPKRVIYLLSGWGEVEHRYGFAGPSEPTPPAPLYAWDRIPGINRLYAKAMRRNGFLVVDPTLAHQQRKDCRVDYMHLRGPVLAQSTWPMLQAAFEAQRVG